MSISGINGLSSSTVANGLSTSLQASAAAANLYSSPSSAVPSSLQNETVYHVRNSSTSTPTRSGGKNPTAPVSGSAGGGGGKRVIFVRLTEAAIQQFEKLALEQYTEHRGSSKKTQHALPPSPTICCFRRKTTNGLERSEGEITLPAATPSVATAAGAAEATTTTRIAFSIMSANNCDNPRSSFECVKLRRRAVNSTTTSGGSVVATGDGAHLGFFRHQFQVRASEAESFSASKRKLQEVKLEDQKSSTKGLTSLPEQAGRRTAVLSTLSSANSHSSSNLLLNNKKVKSHNQAGTIKPVTSAARLLPPTTTSAAKKSPGNALSPLVLNSSPSVVRQQQQQPVKQPVPLHVTKAAATNSTNNSPVITKTTSSPLSSAATVSKPTTTTILTKPVVAQPSTYRDSSNSSKSCQKALVVTAAVSSGSPPLKPHIQKLDAGVIKPPPLPSVVAAASRSGVAAASADKTTGAVAATGISSFSKHQLAPVQPPPEQAAAAINLTTPLAANKNGSPAAGIALLRNNAAPPQPSRTFMPTNAPVGPQQQPRYSAAVNDAVSSTSPKENFAAVAAAAGQNNKFLTSSSGYCSSSSSSTTAAVYGGGNSGEHESCSNSLDRPESAYSSGNESTSSLNGGIGSSGSHLYNLPPASSLTHHIHHHINSNGPGSASSTTSSSSSSSANAASNNDTNVEDTLHYEKLLDWSRSVRQCSTLADRQRLTELYAIDWRRYGRLRQYIMQVRSKFDHLKTELDQQRGRRIEYQRLSERIRNEYVFEMRDNGYKQKREQYERLRTHLSRISTLVQMYDEKREIQLQNKLNNTSSMLTNDVEMLSSGYIGNGDCHVAPYRVPAELKPRR